MFVFNKFLLVTGTIKYENDQELVSGLVSYQTPYIIETGCKFTIAKRNNYIQKSDETHRAEVDTLTVQFGLDEISNLNDTGIKIEIGRTRLIHNDNEYRATKVNNFGQDYRRNYFPIGILEVIFEKRVPLNVS